MAEKSVNPIVKGLIIVGVFGITGTAIWAGHKYIYKPWKAKRDGTGTDTDTTTAPVVTNNAPVSSGYGNTPSTCKYCATASTFPLKKGSRGKQVAAVQYAYNLKYPNKTKLTVDGDWGTKSENAFLALMNGTSSANGWSNIVGFSAAAFNWIASQSGSGGGASGAGLSLTNQGLKIDKSKYDTYFKGFENI